MDEFSSFLSGLRANQSARYQRYAAVLPGRASMGPQQGEGTALSRQGSTEPQYDDMEDVEQTEQTESPAVQTSSLVKKRSRPTSGVLRLDTGPSTSSGTSSPKKRAIPPPRRVTSSTMVGRRVRQIETAPLAAVPVPAAEESAWDRESEVGVPPFRWEMLRLQSDVLKISDLSRAQQDSLRAWWKLFEDNAGFTYWWDHNDMGRNCAGCKIFSKTDSKFEDGGRCTTCVVKRQGTSKRQAKQRRPCIQISVEFDGRGKARTRREVIVLAEPGKRDSLDGYAYWEDP